MKYLLLLSLCLFPFGQIAFSSSLHYEVQVSNELVSENEKLEALKMDWIYDIDISQVMLEDQNDLEKLDSRLIGDLDLLGYFTQLKLNGKVLPFGKAIDSRLVKVKDTLKLSFTLPLSMPIRVGQKSVISLDHEDPSSVAILFYEKSSDIKLNGDLKKRCKPTVEEKGSFFEGEFPQVVKISC